MNIIFIAPPAAGKGTQSELACDKYKLIHISTGDLLREVISKQDSFALQLKEQMKQGKLISDELILDLITNKLENLDGFILDGFPRNVNQAIKLDELLASLNKKIDYVIYFKISKEVALDRIIGRLSCPDCGRVYNDRIISNNPKLEGICDDCNCALQKRSDDNEETFNKRFDTYMLETEPVIDYYKNKNILYEVDSNLDKYEVFKNVEKIINND